MHPDESAIDTLIENCETRGYAAKLARDLSVSKSTITRWVEEKSVPPAMDKLLRLYFFGEIPFGLTDPVQGENLRGALELSEEQYRVIGILATRVSMTPAKWIGEKIRGYLAWDEEARAVAAGLQTKDTGTNGP